MAAATRVLTLGDGDLSYSVALARALPSASITATTFLSEAELLATYDGAAAAIAELRERGACVLHGVDASAPLLAAQFDHIIFNLPHLGLAQLADEAESRRRHRALIAHFLHEAAASLAPGGVVHLTLTGQQPRLWAALPAARRAGLVLVQACEPTTPAAFLLEPTISVRAAEAGWAAARRYRTGVLGTRHWLSKYGYEHRRCDGDGRMALDAAVELVYARPHEAAVVAQPTRARSPVR